MAAGVAPAGAAHDGGSLRETLTVPVAGVTFIELPLQLTMIKATTTIIEPSKRETGRHFSQSWTWASMGASDLNNKVVFWQTARCGTERNGEASTRGEYDKSVLRLLRVSA